MLTWVFYRDATHLLFMEEKRREKPNSLELFIRIKSILSEPKRAIKIFFSYLCSA